MSKVTGNEKLPMKKRNNIVIMDNGAYLSELNSKTFAKNLSSLFEKNAPDFNQTLLDREKTKNLWKNIYRNILTPFKAENNITSERKLSDIEKNQIRAKEEQPEKKREAGSSSDSSSSENNENNMTKQQEKMARVSNPLLDFASEKLSLSRKKIFEITSSSQTRLGPQQKKIYREYLKILSRKPAEPHESNFPVDDDTNNLAKRRNANILDTKVKMEAPSVIRTRRLDSVLDDDPEFLCPERKKAYSVVSTTDKKALNFSTKKLLYIIPNFSKEFEENCVNLYPPSFDDMLSLKNIGERRRCKSFNFLLKVKPTENTFQSRKTEKKSSKIFNANKINASKTTSLTPGTNMFENPRRMSFRKLELPKIQEHNEQNPRRMSYRKLDLPKFQEPVEPAVKKELLLVQDSPKFKNLVILKVSQMKNSKEETPDTFSQNPLVQEAAGRQLKIKKKAPLYERIRRKSCYCKCCGEISKKFKKTWNRLTDKEKLLIKKNLEKEAERLKEVSMTEKRENIEFLPQTQDSDQSNTPRTTIPKKLLIMKKENSALETANTASINLKRYLSNVHPKTPKVAPDDSFKNLVTPSSKRRMREKEDPKYMLYNYTSALKKNTSSELPINSLSSKDDFSTLSDYFMVKSKFLSNLQTNHPSLIKASPSQSRSEIKRPISMFSSIRADIGCISREITDSACKSQKQSVWKKERQKTIDFIVKTEKQLRPKRKEKVLDYLIKRKLNPAMVQSKASE